MTDSNAVAVQQQASVDLETLRAAINATLTDSELRLAIAYAQRRGADLITKQIIPVKFKGKMTFITSIDFMRVIAERSGEYDGQDEPEFGDACGCDEKPAGHPEWAKVLVYRKNMGRPLVGKAYWHEFVAMEPKYDQQGNMTGMVVGSMWQKMPHNQLAKCAEALGLRKAFPNDMSQLYTSEEMDQAGPADHEAGAGASAGGYPDIPPDAERPQWATFDGSVKKEPERGIKKVRRPEWYTEGTAKMVEKIEVKVTPGRGTLTALVMGDLAHPVVELELKEGERVVFDGKRHEYEWEKGKPKAKQARFVTRFAVQRGGAWVEAGVVEGEATEVDQPPDPTTQEKPATPSTSDTAAPAPTTETSESPASTTAKPATPGGDPGPTTPTSAEEEAPPSTPTPSDLTSQAQEAFAELIDADVDPTVTEGAAWEQKPLLEGKPGEVATLTGYFAHGARNQTASGKELWEGWLTSHDMTRRIHVLMRHDRAEATGVYDIGAGEEVALMGTWHEVTEQGLLVLATGLTLAE